MILLKLLFISSVVVTSTLSSVYKLEDNHCSNNEFLCKDGACISSDLVCNGPRDCADGSDEFSCGIGSIDISKEDVILKDKLSHRLKRQASGCRKDQWQCRDGLCIPFDGKCDGVVDCKDGSDERHALCRKMRCQHNWFRCTYGACVDGTAPCNGVQECADNSDELLPKCRNNTDIKRGQFFCQDTSTIPATNLCDGVKDCPDGSDETVRACAGKVCPTYLFQCAYGACADNGADCNGIQECADGSDEAPDLCNKSGDISPTKPVPGSNTGNGGTNPKPGNCILPDYPNHGSYITNIPNGKPGEAYELVTLNVTCHQGYGIVGTSSIYCFNGFWPEQMPKCVRMCRLQPHPSVEYRCLVSGSIQGTRECNHYEPTGTVVSPQCRLPNYYSATTLTFMRCLDGNWDYIARCTPECGRVTPKGEQLVIGGREAIRGELPWHAGIYRKTTNPYMQICGGSLISTTIIISAAHCFWSDVAKQLPSSNYAVAVGKIYRPWNNTMEDAQRSDVRDIKMPARFQGAAANFQDDIALVIVVTAFEYKTYVRPVCVDFDINFERRQLQPGRMGKVAGWGLTAENGVASQILKVLDVPYVSIEQCISESPPGFREYITSDKICAGYKDAGSALCKGDSGGGLTFPESDKGTERYYLRGIVSTAPNNENLCNANTYTSFTQILKHEHFVKEYWTES